jgi:hypothetical protein
MSISLGHASAAQAIKQGVDVDDEVRLARTIGGVASLVTTGAVAVTNGTDARTDG